MGAHTLLGRIEKMKSQQPLVKRYVRILEYRFDRDGELLAASATRPQTFARLAHTLFLHFFFGLEFNRNRRLGLWSYPVGFAFDTAMRTDSAVRPAQGFEVFAGLIFISETRL